MINHHEVPYASLWGSADFQKAPKHHVAWYHVQWFHRFHQSHKKKTHRFFSEKLWNSTRQICFQTEECGKLHNVADRFRHTPSIKNLLATADFALVKVFSSNILSLEFAVSCPPWKWSQDFVVSAFISCSDHKYGSLMVRMCCVIESAKLKIDKVWTLQTCLNIFFKASFIGSTDLEIAMRTEISTHQLSSQHCPKALLKCLRWLGQASSWWIWGGIHEAIRHLLDLPATCHPKYPWQVIIIENAYLPAMRDTDLLTELFGSLANIFKCSISLGHLPIFNLLYMKLWRVKFLRNCVFARWHYRVMYRHIT